MAVVGKRKNIRKIRRGTGLARNMYFNKDTQAAIEEYQVLTGSLDKVPREKIFDERIFPAFNKLVENLINIHNFVGLHDTQEDLKSDCVTFLFESIWKFDPKRGTNAFSYFNIVAKHWLIIQSKKKINKTKKNVSLDDPEALTPGEVSAIEESNVLVSQDEIVKSQDNLKNILEILYKIRDMTKNPNELICMESIISIFENIDDIDLLNKSAILIYIREMSGLSPKQLTMSLSAIKKYYREVKGSIPISEFLL